MAYSFTVQSQQFFLYKQYQTITVEEHYHNKQTTALANGPVIWDGSFPKMALASSFPTSLIPFSKHNE